MNAPLLLFLAVAASAGPHDRPAGNPDTVWGKRPLWHTNVTFLVKGQVVIPEESRECVKRASPPETCRVQLRPGEGHHRWRVCPAVVIGRDLVAVEPSQCGLGAERRSVCEAAFLMGAVDGSRADYPAGLVLPAQSLTPFRDMSGPIVAVYRLFKPVSQLSDKTLASAHIGLDAAAAKLKVRKADLVEALDKVHPPPSDSPRCD